MRQRLLNTLIIICFGLLVVIAFGPSLNLSLYGDDWYVISKYFFNFGPNGARGGYINEELFTTNYGPQFIAMAVGWALFRDWAFPYFLASLVLRIISVFGLFYLVKKISNFHLALVVGSIYAVSAAGAETTDWVYNMNSYLGIFFVLLGLSFYLTKEKTRGWLLMILGYLTVIIRVYVLPFLLVGLYFFKNLTKHKTFTISLLSSLALLLPFLIIKILFPGMGFQGIVGDQIAGGLKIGRGYLSEGRIDFLLYPFIYVGRMSFPWGMEELGNLGFAIYPGWKFLLVGGLMGFFGGLLSWFASRKPGKISLIHSLLGSYLLIFLLKLFIRYQGIWMLKEFPFFAWAYIGILLTLIMLKRFLKALSSRNYKEISFWIIAGVFLYSFLLTWAYGPQVIPIPHSRYLILSAFGLAMLWGWVLMLIKGFKKIQLVFLAVLLLVNIISTRNFFKFHLKAREYNMAQNLFWQVKKEIPNLAGDDTSVFYIENMPPLMFEELFRFGFGYHMQLFYDLPFDEKNFPYGVSTKKDLELAVFDPNYTGRLIGNKNPTKIENVYALRLEGDTLVNITSSVRDELNALQNEIFFVDKY